MTTSTLTPTIVEALRGERLERPIADLARAAGLRALLEDGIYDILGPASPAAPIVIRSSSLRQAPATADLSMSPLSRLRGVLVNQVLRLASVGVTLEHPFAEVVSAWRLDARGELLESFDRLDDEDRARLDADLTAHAVTLRRALGEVPSGWMPRSAVRMSQRLAGGHVLLHDLIDLMVGTTSSVASVALLDVSTSPLGEGSERALRYHALVQTLRASVAPLRVSTFSSATGDLLTYDVDDDMLNRAANDVLGAVRNLWSHA